MFSHFIIFMISIFILATVLFELINLVFLFSLAIAENSIFHFSWFSCFLILSSFMFERFGSKTAPIKWLQREWALPKRQLNLNNNSLAMSIFKRNLEICCYRSIRGEKYQQPLFSEWPKQLWMTAIDVLVNVVFKNGRFWRNWVTMEPESTTSPETSASSFLTICFHWHKSPSRSRWPRAKVWFKQLCAKCRFCCLKTAGKLSARMMLATFLTLPTYSLGGSLVDGILLYCTTQWKKFRTSPHGQFHASYTGTGQQWPKTLGHLQNLAFFYHTRCFVPTKLITCSFAAFGTSCAVILRIFVQSRQFGHWSQRASNNFWMVPFITLKNFLCWYLQQETLSISMCITIFHDGIHWIHVIIVRSPWRIWSDAGLWLLCLQTVGLHLGRLCGRISAHCGRLCRHIVWQWTGCTLSIWD